MRRHNNRRLNLSVVTALGALVFPASFVVAADEPVMLAEIEVVGFAPLSGAVKAKKLPYAVQEYNKEDLEKSSTYSVAEMLSSRAASVTINSAQGNRLQPDLQFRGFTASPLLGLPQGIAVYQNGVRVNETFGDSVNWDLLSASSIERMQVVAGSNPVYGLNALGGAITVQTKTGFSTLGKTAAVTLGSDAARDFSFTAGDNNGRWGYFVALDSLQEDGWRDFSDSEAFNLYSALSWRGNGKELDLYLNVADTELRGNGSVPEELLQQDRSAVFTHPDITSNELAQLSLSFRQRFDESSQLSVNAFYRQNTTDSFNGDGSEFEECEAPLDDDFLCDDDGMVADQFGNDVSEDFDAINNRSERKQHSTGLTAQWLEKGNWWGLPQQLLVGADYIYGKTDFESSVEFAELTSTRGTTESGLFYGPDATDLESTNRTASLYLSDLIRFNNRFSLTLSTRYNDTHITSQDRSGVNPDLEGNHSYKRINAGAGALYRWSDDVTVYGNLQQSSRTPTPVELVCSHPDAPCNLPNSFLADPPLDDVVSLSAELGLRGHSERVDNWRVGLFHSTNRDDIIFQTTGGVSSNQGFFTNAADTVRKGLEVELAGAIDDWTWYANYTYLHASFADGFISSSPNHPQAVAGKLAVASGSRLPGLPEHNLKLGLTHQLTDQLEWGVETIVNSGQYLRGDEANQDDKTAGYGIVNLFGSYQLNKTIEVQLRADNVFDKEYVNFGLYGEPDEVIPSLAGASGRFVGPGAPRQFWLTMKMSW